MLIECSPCEKARKDRSFIGIERRNLERETLTMRLAEDYIGGLGAPPLGAMARLRSPSLFTR